MPKFKNFFLLQFIFFFALPVFAQVDTAWVRRYNGPGSGPDEATALAVDDSGNVCVTGHSTGSGTFLDYTTIKYKPNGDTAWVRRYNGLGFGDDKATALAVDKNGNVYVTGYSDVNATASVNEDYVTIKYGPNGDTLWVRRYAGPGINPDLASALAVDDSGNVYVTGPRRGSMFVVTDYATIKYSPAGDSLWVRRYNGPGNGDDFAYALAVDVSRNVYVTGSSIGSGTLWDYATIKYSPAGETLWVRRYNGPAGNGLDWPYALALDDSGKVYVTGISTGSGTLFDYSTIKYSALGDTQWVKRYDDLMSSIDEAVALALDVSGNVCVTGRSSSDTVSYNNYLTIKYSPAGETLWVRSYNGPASGTDHANALALDDSGNVFVTGGSEGVGASLDYATIKYSSVGDTQWVKRYNGPGNGWDEAQALAVDKGGNVYVTGRSAGSGTSYDYATIKYSSCQAKPGDVNGDGSYTLPDIIAEVNIVFKGAPKPNPTCRADANGDNSSSLPDIIKLVNKVFKGGSTPPKIGVCCL